MIPINIFWLWLYLQYNINAIYSKQTSLFKTFFGIFTWETSIPLATEVAAEEEIFHSKQIENLLLFDL